MVGRGFQYLLYNYKHTQLFYAGLRGVDVLRLPERSYEIVMKLKDRPVVSLSELADLLGRKVSDLMRDLAELESKGLVEVIKEEVYAVSLTGLAREYLSRGFPEEILLRVAVEGRVKSLRELKEAAGLSGDEFSAGLGILKRLGVLEVGRGGELRVVSEAIGKLQEHLRRVKKVMRDVGGRELSRSEFTELRELSELRRRKLVSVSKKKEIRVKATEKLLKLLQEGKVRKARLITVLTEDIITSGSWVDAVFKKFDLSVDVPVIYPKRRHPYIQFLNYVREIVLSMGFIEAKGPHVETELWNFDALFVPQYHPSRRPTDVYFIRDPKLGSEEPQLIERVKKIHESTLGYKWDPRRALRLILRTHTTPVSIRTIYERGEGEYRVFSLDRVFRPDTPDPTHLMEFHQLEGIIVGRKVSFKHLLGFFKEFAKALGFR